MRTDRVFHSEIDNLAERCFGGHMIYDARTEKSIINDARLRLLEAANGQLGAESVHAEVDRLAAEFGKRLQEIDRQIEQLQQEATACKTDTAAAEAATEALRKELLTAVLNDPEKAIKLKVALEMAQLKADALARRYEDKVAEVKQLLDSRATEDDACTEQKRAVWDGFRQQLKDRIRQSMAEVLACSQTLRRIE